MADGLVGGWSSPSPLADLPGVPAPLPPQAGGDFQVEILVRRGADEQVLALAGRWRDTGDGWLESQLGGWTQLPGELTELPVVGAASVHVQRLLRAPFQVRGIELDLQFAESHLRVRNSPTLGIQFVGLTVPGTLTVMSPDGIRGENVDVLINWAQVRNLVVNLVLAPPDRL